MARFLGVKIEHTRKRYTNLVEIGHAPSGRSRVTTLTPQQDVAEIGIYLLRHSRDGSGHPTEIKKLHGFTRRNVRRDDNSRPLFELAAIRRGRRKYDITLHEDGKFQETATIRVPRSPNTLVALLLLVLALLALGLGARALYMKDSVEIDQPVELGQGSQLQRPEQPERRETDEATEAPPETASIPTSKPIDSPAPETKTDAAASQGDAGFPPESTTDDSSPDVPIEAVEPVALTETIYFLPDSVQLTRDGSRTLDRFLRQTDNSETVSVQIEGHTALYGNEAGRERISRGRVTAVVSYLERNGWSTDAPVETEVFGAQAPITRATDQQHLNRRAVLHVMYRPAQQ